MSVSRVLFKARILAECAGRGMDLAQTHAHVKEALAAQLAERDRLHAKQAGVLSEMVEGPYRLGQALIGAGWPYAMAGAVSAPLVAGGTVGWGLAQTHDDDSDIEEAKADELVQEYRRLAQGARLAGVQKGLQRL